MNKKILALISPTLGLGLFILAVTVLHHELKEYHFHDLKNALRLIPPSSILWAALFVLLNYMILAVYELLGFSYIGNKLPWNRIVFTSFISYAFSNNVGFYTISGSAVRFRLYSQFGLSGIDITRLIVFVNGAAFWLGLCAICALVFTVEPMAVPLPLRLPAHSTTLLGIFFCVLLAAGFLFTIIRKTPLRFRQWEFSIPRPPLLLGLVATACLDWLLCGAALYALLPSMQLSFPMFMGFFLLSMLAGLVSHVPGGLGVFETTMLLVLPHGDHAAVFSALLAFRGLYYIIPLLTASALLGAYEVKNRRDQLADTLQKVGRWGTGVVPYLFAIMIFIGGLILLFSGATPAEHHRWIFLTRFLPMPMLEVSHFMGSLFGIALVMLAWGLYRRLDGAYHFTLYILAGGAVFSLLKGLDWEEATIMMAMVLILLPCRKLFYRRTSLVHDRFSPGWMFMVAISLVSTIWLGLFTYKHVQYSSELWWRFGIHDHASRFMRAVVGSMVAAFTFSLIQFLAPARRSRAGLQSKEPPVAKIKDILDHSPSTTGWLSLLGDKKILFDDTQKAFIMYGIQGRSWVAMGDPVGDPAVYSPLIWKFREECDRNNGRPVFYEISRNNLPYYLDLGLSLLKMGEEARVALDGFTLEGSARKSARYTINRLEKEGCTFDIVPADGVSALLPELKSISDEWLATKKVREKQFSLGCFHEPYLIHTPMAVVRRNNAIVAFANVWPSGTKEELSIDLMRYSENAPKSVIEYLFGRLMLWGSVNGYHWFNLGMAPFSGFEERALAPLWHRVGALLYRHGDNFYNFQGLREFKEKFHPVWEPRYLAAPGGLGLPLIFKDISSLISGGLKGIFSK
jgi:phosphatidylglycerol lysyltransferase